MVSYLVLFCATFLSVGLRVVQTRNIVSLNYKAMFLTSIGIDFSMVIGVTSIVSEGWQAFFPIALGGALGSVTFAYLHKKFYG